MLSRFRAWRARRADRNRVIAEARTFAWSFEPTFSHWHPWDFENPSGAKGPLPPQGPRSRAFARDCERELQRAVGHALGAGRRLDLRADPASADATVLVAMTGEGLAGPYKGAGREGVIVSGAKVSGTISLIPNAGSGELDGKVLPPLVHRFTGLVPPPQSYMIRGPRLEVRDPPFVSALEAAHIERIVRRMLGRGGTAAPQTTSQRTAR